MVVSKVDRLFATETERQGGSPVAGALVMALALLFSGAAALVNQVAWQGSLKRFLAGSETISSMLVVLIFMAGLGAGSIVAARYAARLSNPLGALALVEGLLALVNLGVCLALRSDLTDSIYSLQLLAASSGVPYVSIFAATAGLILLVPCLLMGATIPLAGETCQRWLGLTNPRVLGLLFFVNTLGSVAGAAAASFYWIPRLGFTLTLGLGIGFNAVAAAALVALGLAWSRGSEHHYLGAGATESVVDRSKPSLGRLNPRPAEILAFGLGFCSLGYEMILFRLFALELRPLPYTFAAVVAGFLLFWSLGAGASSRFNLSVGRALGWCALSLSLPLLGFYYWWALETGVLSSPPAFWSSPTAAPYLAAVGCSFIPCLLFGYLFGKLASQVATTWGYDVGRLYASNTLGACLGIVAVTFIGYEMHVVLLLLAISLLLQTLRVFWRRREPLQRSSAAARLRHAAALAVVVVVLAFSADFSAIFTGGRLRLFFGRDGVVGVDPAGNMFWDGLWHSQLSHDNDHVGTNNWKMAVCGVLSHPSGQIRDVCVVGLGTGITAGTLAKLAGVERVDVYEINRGLESPFHRRYPEGTLRAVDNPNIRVFWQDARTGLAVREQAYDLITTQPLYLIQAGSGFLNSREFFTLVRRRLKPGGIFCLYSRGTEAQKRAVRETAAQVFPHGESFFNGYLLVLSDRKLALNEDSLEERFNKYANDPLWREIRSYEETRDTQTVLAQLDRPRHSWNAHGLIVTDDHPVVEYPNTLKMMLKEREAAATKSNPH